MDRNERLLRLIILLRQAAQPLTREQIFAAHAGYRGAGIKPASADRQFERDKKALRDMGLSLEVAKDEMGNDVGYRLGAGKPPHLRCGQADRLVLAAAADALASVPGMPLRAAALNALAKLVEAPVAEPLRQRQGDDRLVAVIDQLGKGRALSFRYRGRHTRQGRAVILDDGLLELRGSYWYITGHDRQRQADRSFRLERITSTVKGVRAGTGKRQDPAWNVWHLRQGAAVEAVLRPGHTPGPLPDGLLREATSGAEVVVRTSNRLALLRWLCSGCGWRLLGPESLCAELRQILSSVPADVS
jgi:predicted DNA-binding transcriptional regulator YafY